VDSLTQIVLGAAVGEALLGKKLGNKALLLGAIAGTIPDLDVMLNIWFKDPIDQIRIHRSYSHSMFTHIVLAWPLAWFSFRRSKADITRTRWYIFWFLGLFTHALLDCGTAYGTRFLLPFTDYQVAFNNINVIDPSYTIPWLIILIIAMFYKRNSVQRNRWVMAGWIYSSAYMLSTFGLKAVVHQKFEKTLTEQHINHYDLTSTPTILNAVLWSGIAIDRDTISVAEYSFLNSAEPITWVKFPRNKSLAAPFAGADMQTTKWFADDHYLITGNADSINFYTLKWGRTNYYESQDPEKVFLFYNKFKRNPQGNIVVNQVTPREGFNMKLAFANLIKRIGL
jgi:inner membrane protein